MILGVRNIDILLAKPNSPESKGLGNVHVFLETHMHSGAWMIRANHPIRINRVILHIGEQQCLSDPSTCVEINQMSYIFEFAPKTEKEEKEYLEDPNAAFKARVSVIISISGHL